MPWQELQVRYDEETEPRHNLSTEEEIFQDVEDGRSPETLRFWRNDRCLVRGPARSQKYGWYREDLAAKLGIQVIDRPTGGGVVYHDLGNMNWSFFLKTSGAFLSPRAAFEMGSKYVIEALKTLGVQAGFSPPNRIDVSGTKVSGMAAKSTVRTLLVHGTLLVRSDLEMLDKLCIPPPGCPPVSNLSSWAKNVSVGRITRAVVEALERSGHRIEVAK